MKRAILCASAKGGVGKSTFARAVLDISRRRGLRVAAYDADPNVGHLLRFYGERDAAGAVIPDQDPLRGVGYFDVRDRAGREQLVSSSVIDADLLLIDIPGGALDAVGAVLPGGVGELCDLYREDGWEPVVAWALTGLEICSTSFVRFAEAEPNVPLTVVKNLADGADAFFLFDGDGGELSSGRPSRMLAERGGSVIAMPGMDKRTFNYVDARRITFHQAATTEPSLQYRSVRRWMEAWLRAFEGELDRWGLFA